MNERNGRSRRAHGNYTRSNMEHELGIIRWIILIMAQNGKLLFIGRKHGKKRRKRKTQLCMHLVGVVSKGVLVIW